MSHKLLSAREADEGGKISIQVRHKACGDGDFAKQVMVRINKKPGIIVFTIRGFTIDGSGGGGKKENH